jgi:hypothetical protein
LDAPTEDRVGWDVVRTGFTEIIAWINRANDFVGAGARSHASATVLNPIDSRYRNLSEISRDNGVHRATLSAALRTLFDNIRSRFLSVNSIQTAVFRNENIATMKETT